MSRDLTEWSIAGEVVDHRDGTCTVLMGKPTEQERLQNEHDEAVAIAGILAGDTAPETLSTPAVISAVALRAKIETAAAALPDDAAADAVELFPRLKGDGALVKAGTRINWNGEIKRAAVDLWDTAQNTPSAAPTLWEDIVLQGEYREIPATITAGLAFALGERGWWKGKLYQSKISANVWTPDAYPAGWELVT